MNLEYIDDREITFTHNPAYWPPNTTVTESEIKWDNFLRNRALPYLVRICESSGVKTYVKPTDSLGEPKANIRFEAFNFMGYSHMKSTIESPLEIINLSQDILGEYRIMMN